MPIDIIGSGDDHDTMAALREELAQTIISFCSRSKTRIPFELVGSLLGVMAGQAYAKAGAPHPLIVAEMIGINAIEGMGHQDLALSLTDALQAKRPYLMKQGG